MDVVEQTGTIERAPGAVGEASPAACELTILMPCLNEAETLAACIADAKAYLTRSGVVGEILIADNGSTDGSIAIAEAAGARVVPIPERGYGAALRGGIAAARGRYIVFGDADHSYDFANLDAFVAALRRGDELVMGNRFRGGIGPGAMPFLHKYLGNPVLSFLGRLFYSIEVGDFHCGLRGFDTARMRAIGLRCNGMEFASEMVVRSALAQRRITEVPTVLRKDGRSRPPHLRTWRDGWRHLRFLLLFSPRWLFFYPGVALMGFGALLVLLLLPGSVHLTPSLSLDVHSFLVASVAIIIGQQCVSFAIVARRYAAARGFLPLSDRVERYLKPLTLERVLLIAAPLALLGIAGFVWCLSSWAGSGFGPLAYGSLVRGLTISLTAIAVALQLVLTAFMAAILEIE